MYVLCRAGLCSLQESVCPDTRQHSAASRLSAIQTANLLDHLGETGTHSSPCCLWQQDKVVLLQFPAGPASMRRVAWIGTLSQTFLNVGSSQFVNNLNVNINLFIQIHFFVIRVYYNNKVGKWIWRKHNIINQTEWIGYYRSNIVIEINHNKFTIIPQTPDSRHISTYKGWWEMYKPIERYSRPTWMMLCRWSAAVWLSSTRWHRQKMSTCVSFPMVWEPISLQNSSELPAHSGSDFTLSLNHPPLIG